MSKSTIALEKYIRDIPDFPKKGIIFKDITPLLQSKEAFHYAIQQLAKPAKDKKIDLVVGVEARGFIFGAAVAYHLGVGFIPIRKPGKLPHKTLSHTYDLEYGQDTIEIHEDAIKKGERVLVVDDVLATGGTIAAVCHLLNHLGAEIVDISFLMELTFLHGREKIKKYPISSVLTV